jgi:NADP oxidoreductase coenzyme F420-dependent
MKVGVLGSGDVAKALADDFAKHGHHVVMAGHFSAISSSLSLCSSSLLCGTMSTRRTGSCLVGELVPGSTCRPWTSQEGTWSRASW